ncbi:MAG: tryptophan--tRNA ligase [Oscillospiraceae bacterium]|jgi:tryptophanyl-tRNA synthetase|nr:tryptophan--tRNA ligase [Oscillospiraceae bacterium]
MMKKRILSGVQPSGTPTLGNYLGAFRSWVALQDDPQYESVYCVVDMHAITVRRDREELRRQTRELYALLLAIGLDPQKNVLFIQSQVPQHAELTWVLNCYTMFGELSRMTQFKEKSARHPDNINAGLFDYPVLMAADILLYQAHLVPVGGDQKQHVELTRDIAVRFNGVHPDVFTLPEPYIPPVGARIMSLTDPTRKMDKSDPNPASHVLLTESPDAIMKKFKKAVTDSDARVCHDTAQKPGVSNLMAIYSLATGLSLEETERKFEGQGYGAFKPAVGEAVVELLRPVRERVEELLRDPGFLEAEMARGRERASAIAEKTMADVRHAVGFLPRETV